MEDGEDDITNCPVCFEDYGETGDHLPRILPCYHTVCEKCIGELLQDDALDCPECRVNHLAGNGVKIFPQNRYILTHMRMKSIVTVGKNEVLQTKLDVVAKDLKLHREKILGAKEELEKQNATVVSKITARRDLVMRVVSRRFEKLLQEAADQMKELNKNISQEVAVIDESLVLLDSIRETSDDTLIDEDISNQLETVKGIAKQAKVTMAKERKIRSFNYVESQATVEDVKKLSGELIDKETRVMIKEGNILVEDVKVEPKKKKETPAEISQSDTQPGGLSTLSSPSLRCKRNPLQFNCQGNLSFLLIAKAMIFLFVGLHHTFRNFKVRRSEKKKKN